MNAEATAHLAKAKEYVAKGEQFYRMAAEQIMAAQTADSTLGNREIGEWFSRSEKWVRDLVQWHTSADVRPTPYAEDTPRRTRAAAKQALREQPEVVTELSVDEQRELAKTLDNEAAKRQKARETESRQKEREHLGAELVDDLELKEELQKTEYLLIKARGELRGFVKQTSELGLENTPDAWRESCLDWIEDLEGHLSMARTLLTDGTIIDMTAFEEMLNDA